MQPTPAHDPAAHSPPPWRGFGQRADLDLDFSAPDRPELVTAVLTACSVQPVDSRGLWSLTLAERIGALVHIVVRTEGGDSIALTLRCPQCADALELAVPCAMLLHEAQRSESEIEVALDAARSVRVRRPTGADQRVWRTRAYSNEDEAAAAVLHSLTAPAGAHSDLDAADLERISDAMNAFDPLASFQITTVCPSCGAEATLPVDLEAALLMRLRARQRALLAQVHRLAAAYGWTEEQVLAIPAHRREQYLLLVEQEAVQR
ncbi:MAG: hypothetical protein GWN84_13085 [Gammaproteobacteria bacterium]|nr:hypothetical protein [Gammaproteobacteria bacterium]NIR58155.1 hypothetical protein [Gammaproteobacteria bacterium]NIR88151.1 hypothetical protein [Gammaproteobacteria bacterium]